MEIPVVTGMEVEEESLAIIMAFGVIVLGN
jgi:hypothetical protein